MLLPVFKFFVCSWKLLYNEMFPHQQNIRTLLSQGIILSAWTSIQLISYNVLIHLTSYLLFKLFQSLVIIIGADKNLLSTELRLLSFLLTWNFKKHFTFGIIRTFVMQNISYHIFVIGCNFCISNSKASNVHYNSFYDSVSSGYSHTL